MANADFSRQQNQPTGGFDASSYRAAAPAEEEVRLTPFQQKLASLEKALPAALGKQAVAVALCIVVMLGCFVGFGGAKLRAKYDTVKNGFTTGVAADSGYTLNEELTTRLNTAANIITTASNTLGADSTEVQTAQAALDSFSACLGAVQSDQYADGDYYLTYGDGFRSTMLADQASSLVQTMEDDFAAKKYDAAVLTCATNVANTVAEVYGVTLSGGTIYSDGSDTQTTRPSVEPVPPQGILRAGSGACGAEPLLHRPGDRTVINRKDEGCFENRMR